MGWGVVEKILRWTSQQNIISLCETTISMHRILTYFVRGSITVQLTSCLTGLDLTKQVNLLFIHHEQSSWIQTNKTGGQAYSDTSPLASKLVFCALWHSINQSKRWSVTRSSEAAAEDSLPSCGSCWGLLSFSSESESAFVSSMTDTKLEIMLLLLLLLLLLMRWWWTALADIAFWSVNVSVPFAECLPENG